MTDSGTPPGRGNESQRPVKRRSRIAMALLALIGIGGVSNGSVDPHAIAAVLKDPLSLFAQRSPGERAPGALTQTKPKYHVRSLVRRAPLVPEERMLSTGRRRTPLDLEPGSLDTPGGIFAAGAPIDDAVALFGGPGLPGGVDGAGGGGATTFLPPAANGPGVGTLEPGGGGGGGGGVTPPSPAVPEPSTWLTMMAGVLAIGWSLRRRRSAEATRAEGIVKLRG